MLAFSFRIFIGISVLSIDFLVPEALIFLTILPTHTRGKLKVFPLTAFLTTEIRGWF